MVAVLGFLVWADARWADSAECTSYGVHTDGRPGRPAQLADRVDCVR